MEVFNVSEKLAKLKPQCKENINKYLKQIHWKNDPPAKGEQYKPTAIEHKANILTHGLWVAPIIWYSYCLIKSATTPEQYGAATVYSCVLVGLFSVSTFFHIVAARGKDSLIRDLLHRGDRAMIYLFIAGSYTPWLTLKAYDSNGWSVQLNWVIWILATLGIIYQQIFHERYKWLETTIYMTVALAPSLAVFEMKEDTGVAELQHGGAIYLIGVVFFKLDGRLPLAHAIWHLHVVVASMIHYYAVAHYLMGPQPLASLSHSDMDPSDLHSL